MSKKILITGATGLVGKQLISLLQARGHELNVLSRRKNDIPGVNVYLWDVDKQTVEDGALAGVDAIIHLAGEGIADQKWTDARKQQIIDSRVQSAKLLYKAVKTTGAPVKSFISASAVGYYGDRGEEFLAEEAAPGTGFLAECCVKWEAAADEGLAMGIRVVKIRIGVILSKDGGALTAMAKPIKLFVGAPLGTGKQWVPWVHIDDITGLFAKAVEDDTMNGSYNAAAPYPVTNKLLTKRIAWHLNRPVWPFHVPKAMLNLLLGEMSSVVLMSSNTVAQKTLDSGYQFKYLDLDEALREIYG